MCPRLCVNGDKPRSRKACQIKGCLKIAIYASFPAWEPIACYLHHTNDMAHVLNRRQYKSRYAKFLACVPTI